VLTRAGTVHRQRPLDQTLGQCFGAFDLIAIIHVAQQRQMEVAIADMTDNRRQETARLDVELRFGHAFGEPRDRYTAVSGHRSDNGAREEIRQCCVMCRAAGAPRFTQVVWSGEWTAAIRPQSRLTLW
jgi:hypothetical protein